MREANAVFETNDFISEEFVQNTVSNSDPDTMLLARIARTPPECSDMGQPLESEEVEVVFRSGGESVRRVRRVVYAGSVQEEPSVPVEDEEKVTELDKTPIKVWQSRCLPARNTTSYMTCVVAELKCKFGTPAATEANRLAIRRTAHDIMKRHGLRPTHIMRILDKCVVYTLTPNAYEVESRMVENSATVRGFRSQYARASPNRWGMLSWLNPCGHSARGPG